MSNVTVAAKTTTPFTHTGDTTETPMTAPLSIAANTVPADGVLDIDGMVEGSLANATGVVNVYIGPNGNATDIKVASGTLNAHNPEAGHFRFTLAAANATNAQLGWVPNTFSVANLFGNDIGQGNQALATFGVDFTVANKVTATLKLNNASDSLTLKNLRVLQS